MATFWERAAHSVNHIFSLFCVFVVLVVSHLGFEGGDLVLIVPAHGHCIPLLYILHFKMHHKLTRYRKLKRAIPNQSIVVLSLVCHCMSKSVYRALKTLAFQRARRLFITKKEKRIMI